MYILSEKAISFTPIHIIPFRFSSANKKVWETRTFLFLGLDKVELIDYYISARLRNTTEKQIGGDGMTTKECNGIVPENIDRIIKERGLKQGFVADKANFSKQQFSDMLNGRKVIKVCDVVAIADALGVSIGDLYEAGAVGNG